MKTVLDKYPVILKKFLENLECKDMSVTATSPLQDHMETFHLTFKEKVFRL